MCAMETKHVTTSLQDQTSTKLSKTVVFFKRENIALKIVLMRKQIVDLAIQAVY
jgi:hypothetical protein